MKKLIALLVILALLLAVVLVSVKKVPVDRVGVKILQLGGGVAGRDFPPGYVFCLPGIHRLELMDPTLQFFTIGPDGTGRSLALRSSDQFVTHVDVTVVYRIKGGEAHLALGRHGGGEAFKTKLQSYAEKAIWEELAKLTTEEYYNPQRRLEAAEGARESLNENLADAFLEVLEVLVRNIRYDPDFERKLLDRQLLDQRQQLEASKSKLETEKEKTDLIGKETEAKVIAIEEELKAEVNKLVAETDAQVAQIEADAQLHAQTALAEATNHERQKIAEGELLKTLAQAKGDKAVAAAYAGTGGKLYLTRQLVESIEIGEIELNTNSVNPFDVSRMLEMLGLELPAAPVPAAEAPLVGKSE